MPSSRPTFDPATETVAVSYVTTTTSVETQANVTSALTLAAALPPAGTAAREALLTAVVVALARTLRDGLPPGQSVGPVALASVDGVPYGRRRATVAGAVGVDIVWEVTVTAWTNVTTVAVNGTVRSVSVNGEETNHLTGANNSAVVDDFAGAGVVIESILATTAQVMEEAIATNATASVFGTTLQTAVQELVNASDDAALDVLVELASNAEALSVDTDQNQTVEAVQTVAGVVEEVETVEEAVRYPSSSPSAAPSTSHGPSETPTKSPSPQPTASPTKAPSHQPTKSPTMAPTRYPSSSPSAAPSTSHGPTETSAPTTAIQNLSCPPLDGPIVIVAPGQKSIAVAAAGTFCGIFVRRTNNALVPMARSYDGEEWEAAPGPQALTMTPPSSARRRLSRNAGSTGVTLPGLSSDEEYVLLSRDGRAENRPQIARFLETTTFGPRRAEVDLLDDGSWARDGAGLRARHLRQQMDLPATSHREYWRRRTNAKWDAAVPLARSGHPCSPNSKWRKYTYTPLVGCCI